MFFLANIDPSLQLEALRQMKKPSLVVLDTMNFWISSKKKELLEIIKKPMFSYLTTGKQGSFFETANLVKAANSALKLGPKAVIIKKGSMALYCSQKQTF